MQFGQYLKNKRLEKRITLREFCRSLNIDSGNHSKLERGLINPPSCMHKIYRFCRALGEDEGSEFYNKLVELSALDRMRIPEYLADKREVLPIVFGLIKNRDFSAEDIGSLLRDIGN